MQEFKESLNFLRFTGHPGGQVLTLRWLGTTRVSGRAPVLHIRH